MEAILFTIFCFYMIGYIFMGIYQPLSALVRLVVSTRKNSSYACGLKKYLCAVAVYFIVLFITVNFSNYDRTLFNIYLFAIPWAHSIWLIRHLKAWKKKKTNILAYDRMLAMSAPSPDRLELEALPSAIYKLKKLNSTLKIQLHRELN